MGFAPRCLVLLCLAVFHAAAEAQDNLRYYTTHGKVNEASNTCTSSIFAACGPDWEVRQSTTGYFRIIPLRPLAVVEGQVLQCPEGVATWAPNGDVDVAVGTFWRQVPVASDDATCLETGAVDDCYTMVPTSFSSSAAGAANTLRVTTVDGPCTALYTLTSANVDVLGVVPQTYSARWTWSSAGTRAGGKGARLPLLSAGAAALAAALLLA